MRLYFCWPSAEDHSQPDEFFIGGWNPAERLTIDLPPPQTDPPPQWIESDNWFLMSSRSPLDPRQPSLVHGTCACEEQCGGAVAFRGYLLDPPYHSWSPSPVVLRYWLHSSCAQHNGVFAAARICDSGHALELISDALGIAPLYYRTWGRTVLFSTNPRYLASASDSPDLLAWRCLVQSGFICGDRSLSTEISRVPPGHVLRMTADGTTSRCWFSYADVAEGTRIVDAQAVAEVEAAFQNALHRCLALKADEVVLALSSGYDSRRILASLIAREVPFQALTVRVLQKATEYRDLDGRWASAMARDFGFRHTVLELPAVADYVRDDRLRAHRLDAETRLHTWALTLGRALPARPALLFEGLAGDVLGDSNGPVPKLGNPKLHTADGPDKLELFARLVISNGYDRILRSTRWPAAADVRRELFASLHALPAGSNQTDLAFLLLRTRRSAALWSQQLMPIGHVTVYPYLDLDYIRTALRYDPLHKMRTSLQELCLRACWPRYYAYPGTSAIPPGTPPGASWQMEQFALACARRLETDINAANALTEVYRLLSPRACLAKWAASWSAPAFRHASWWLVKILELVTREVSRKPCWASAPEGQQPRFTREARPRLICGRPRDGLGSKKSRLSRAHSPLGLTLVPYGGAFREHLPDR